MVIVEYELSKLFQRSAGAYDGKYYFLHLPRIQCVSKLYPVCFWLQFVCIERLGNILGCMVHQHHPRPQNQLQLIAVLHNTDGHNPVRYMQWRLQACLAAKGCRQY